ncbi:MAG: hypothetical protein OXG98_01170 [Gemmatimonadetes bacterium]|nr:hypothetical protein [Gemmatimonadota bacterium]
MNERKPHSSNEEVMVEIYYKDNSIKNRLARLEASDDHIRYLIESNATYFRWIIGIILAACISIMIKLVFIP